MINYIKWIFGGILVGCIIFAAAYYGINQNGNTRTIREVESLLSTSVIGELRESQQIELDPKEVISNVVLKVIKVQKNHGKNIRIQYVFLDKKGVQTEESKHIDSVQFKVELINEKNEIESQAEQRLSLNSIEDLDRT
ncbi:hypothetical protein MH050_03510 [Bacillus licheniformis]|uniref:hypothetical protein n=1 Tax=Bacillus TaxID=1386 RepID=UPI0011A0BB04|nr:MULTISPECIES: hypothetical protein [Bacillus subtilis group]MCA1181434.1 hypothetical protein [Bacillus licheniformis]MCM3210440.1 hypothetical protein [Bacillus licheniformis]MCM3286046.1 hypothetical protein [Bacillus licheniformis]MCY7739915.1 hypothetical protein [Bacillus licheniformis]MEC2101928.1 hypothetical protein [Bacillus licheniformis]